MAEQVKIKNKPHNEHKQTGADAKVINKIVDFVIYILAYRSLYNNPSEHHKIKSLSHRFHSFNNWVNLGQFFCLFFFPHNDETTTINRNQMHLKSITSSEQAIREKEKKTTKTAKKKRKHWEIKINDCPRKKKGYLAHNTLCYEFQNHFVHLATLSYKFGPSLNNYINNLSTDVLERKQYC